MYINNFEIGKQEISIALMILFAMAAMFFIGYKYAYDKAISYANEQIEESIEKFKIDHNLKSDNPDYIIGNIDIEIPDFGGVENEE